MESKSFRIYETEDFCLRLEYSKDVCAIHLPYVNKWTPSVFKTLGIKVYDVMEFVKELGYPCLYAGHPEGNTKVAKLCAMLGFEFSGNSNGYDVWSLR